MNTSDPVRCLSIITACTDTAMEDPKLGFRIFVFASSLNRYPFQKINKSADEEPPLKKRKIDYSPKTSYKRDVLLIYLRRPTNQQLIEIFKTPLKQIQEKNNSFQEKDMNGLVVFCGRHYRTLVFLWEVLQQHNTTDFHRIIDKLVAKIFEHNIDFAIDVSLVRLALIGDPVSLDLMVKTSSGEIAPLSNFIQDGTLFHAFIETQLPNSLGASNVVDPDRIVPVLTPIALFCWALQNNKPTDTHYKLANAVYNMLNASPVYVRAGPGIEHRFHKEWEAVWRMIAPNVFPRYSQTTKFLMQFDKTNPKIPALVPEELKSTDPSTSEAEMKLIDTLQYVYNLTDLSTNIEAVDVVTHDLIIANSNYTCNVIDLFIAGMHSDQSDTNKNKIIRANRNETTDVVVCNWYDLQTIYGQSLLDLAFFFEKDWK